MLDDGRRLPPPRPYRPVEQVLQVPLDAAEVTLQMLRRAGERETGLFWYGLRGGPVSIVTSVRAPKQRMTLFNYQVSGAAMTAMTESLGDALRPLAQVHSHPGLGVEHSPFDDLMASTRKALSLVFPRYGRLAAQWPDGIGVHEWQVDYWHLLSPTQARTRVVLVPRANVERVDFR